MNHPSATAPPLHEVREFAGHADIRTTEVYFVAGGRRRGGGAANPHSRDGTHGRVSPRHSPWRQPGIFSFRILKSRSPCVSKRNARIIQDMMIDETLENCFETLLPRQRPAAKAIIAIRATSKATRWLHPSSCRGTGWRGRLHHASLGWLPAPRCGFTTCSIERLTRPESHRRDHRIVGCSIWAVPL